MKLSYVPMRNLLWLLLFPLALQAEGVRFAKDRYSLEFPEDWKKAKAPHKQMILYRENEAGAASMGVITLPVKEGTKADLRNTFDSIVKSLTSGTLKLEGEPTAKMAPVDGKTGMFGTMRASVGDDTAKTILTFAIVIVDAKDELVILQSTLRHPMKPEDHKKCIKVIQSFKEHKPGDRAEESRP